MEEVLIVCRDINGRRTNHFLRWDSAYDYIQSDITDEDEILLVIVEGACIYSSLSEDSISKFALLGLFA